MTKRERFMNFLANKPVDRVPVALFHHFVGIDMWFKGLENEEAFEANIIGHKKSRDVFDPDVIKVMNDSLMMINIDMSFVEKASDLRNIKPPMPGSLFFEKSKELTKRALAYYADSDAPKYVTGFSPMMVLRNNLVGLDLGTAMTKKPLIVEFMEEDPDSVVEGLRLITECIKALNEMLIKECGADAVYFSVNNQQTYVPEDLYRKYVMPFEKEILAHANAMSDMNALHVCGYKGKGNNLELFKDYEAAWVNWAVHAEGVGLAEGKKLFGGKPVAGGFEQATDIYTGTREEIEQHVFQILDEAGTVGVMIGADCTVPTDIDDNRLEWVRQACIKYAQTHK